MRISQAVLDAIAAHARREHPVECCGLLIGAGDNIIEAVAARNVAPEPHRHYEVSPEDHFAQVKRCRELGRAGGPPLGVVGAYHSHPRSAPLPSPTDVERACEELVYLIAGPVEASPPMEIRAFRFRSGAFEPLDLQRIEASQRTPAEGHG